MSPLFILAPPRSFTSVTCAMLGEHPQMFGLAEVNLFGGDTLADMENLYTNTAARLQSGLLRSLAQLAFSEQTEEAVGTVRQWLLENSNLSTAELFRTMQSWLPDRVLIDKSPLHVYTPNAMARMRTHFPDARYLHLTRHPGDMLKSLLQVQHTVRDRILERAPRLGTLRRPPPRMNADAPEQYWLQPHLAIIEFLESVPDDQYMRLRGEDLLSDPPIYLGRIAEWLGVRTDDEAIEAMLHPENSPFASYGPPSAKFGNDPNFMEKPALRPYTYTQRPLTWEPESGQPVEVGETIREYAMQFGY
jgi:hypothetical protein